MQSVTAGSINFQTVPYVGTDRDDKNRSIIRLKDEATLRTFFAELSADPKPQAEPSATAAPETVAPSEVPVNVYNGSGVSGVAKSAAADLQAQGFTVPQTGNADNTEYTATEIRYAAGDQALATTLAKAIPGVTMSQSDEPTSGTVDLVIGSDFNGIGQALRTPPPTEPVKGKEARTAAGPGWINWSGAVTR